MKKQFVELFSNLIKEAEKVQKEANKRSAQNLKDWQTNDIEQIQELKKIYGTPENYARMIGNASETFEVSIFDDDGDKWLEFYIDDVYQGCFKSKKEAAEYFGLTQSALSNYLKLGKIPFKYKRI